MEKKYIAVQKSHQRLHVKSQYLKCATFKILYVKMLKLKAHGLISQSKRQTISRSHSLQMRRISDQMPSNEKKGQVHAIQTNDLSNVLLAV